MAQCLKTGAIVYDKERRELMRCDIFPIVGADVFVIVANKVREMMVSRQDLPSDTHMAITIGQVGIERRDADSDRWDIIVVPFSQCEIFEPLLEYISEYAWLKIRLRQLGRWHYPLPKAEPMEA